MNADDGIDISTEKYTDEQKKKDIILSQFQNIAKYIEGNEPVNNLGEINFVDLLVNDYDVKKFNNERYEFYRELDKIIKHDPRIFNMIIKLYNKTKMRKKKEKKIIKQLKSLGVNMDDISSEIYKEDKEKRYLEKVIDAAMRGGGDINSIINETEVTDKIDELKKTFEGDKEQLLEYLEKKYKIKNLNKLKQSIVSDEAEENNLQKVINSFQTSIKKYNKQSDPTKKEAITELETNLDNFENSVDNPLEVFKLTREDRLVFILVTFFIRYVTVLMVQWCIDINVIRDFYQGFLLYAILYIVIFWFIVMFVNIDVISTKSYMNIDNGMSSIRNIFYYFYMGTNGITRLLTHSFLIIFLLTIPILLNIKEKNNNDDENILNYEERKKLIKTLSLFTIFIWVLTSIISTKF